jgi:hypothetical protein
MFAFVGKMPMPAGNQLIPSEDHSSKLFVVLLRLFPPATQICPFHAMLLNEEFKEKAACPVGEAKNVIPS